MKKTLGILLFLVCISVYTPSDGFSYSLAGDWSNDVNPNGVWSYNEGDNPLKYNLANWPTGEFGVTQTAWVNGNTDVIGVDSFLPGWFKSVGDPNQLTTTTPSSLNTYDWIAGDVVVHTSRSLVDGAGNGYANVTWTSPFSGVFNVDGGLWAGRDVNRRNNWSLYLDGNILTSGSVYSGDPFSRSNPNSFSLQDLYIAEGSILKLEIVRDTSDDFVGVNFDVNPSAVPEPASILLLGLGGAGMLLRRFRQKNI